MIYVASDLHFGHQNIIKYSNRPFEDVEEMNEHMIQTWNSRVTPRDTVYYLGDFSFRPQGLYLSRLNGNKILIKGNHDYSKHMSDLWSSIYSYYELRHNKKKYCLFHYPIESWNGKEKGVRHLHGHVHGPSTEVLGRLNINADSPWAQQFNYGPIHIDEVETYFEDNNDLPE